MTTEQDEMLTAELVDALKFILAEFGYSLPLEAKAIVMRAIARAEGRA